MDIRDTVNYFSRQVFVDAYTGTALFTGHFDIYSGVTRDSVTGNRRTITVSPNAIVPTRRCIKRGSEVMIVGEVVSDYTQDEVLKNHLICHPSDGLMEIKSSAEAIAGTPTTAIHFGKSWRKSWKDDTESSEIFNIYNLYCASSETLPERNSVAVIDSRLYRVNSIERSTGGFAVVVVAELEADAVQTVTYSPVSGAYDPVTDTKAASASFQVSVIWEWPQTTFRNEAASVEKFLSGDVIVTTSNIDVPSPETGDYVTLKGVDSEVIGVSTYITSSELHVRPL